MTLNELIRKAQAMSRQLSSGDVELIQQGSRWDDITFELKHDEDGYWIEVDVL
jgi:hypothetical protein